MDIFDPTGLTSVRARLGRETTRRWVKTARDVKRAIVQDDVLGIGFKSPRTAQPVADKAQMFKRWIDEQLMTGVVGHDADWLEAPIRKASSWGAVGVSMVYDDFDPDESRDDHGRWTASGQTEGGMTAVSPSQHELDLGSATAALGGDKQAKFAAASADIDTGLGMHGHDVGVVGAWADGAENSLVTLTQGASWDQLQTSAAMKGHLTNQKAVLAFQQDPKGSAVLYDFEAPGSVADIHKALIEDGVAFHSIAPHVDGKSATVYVADLDGTAHAAVAKSAERFDARVNYQVGHASFIGSDGSEGDDAAQRAAGRQAYEGVIGQSKVPGAADVWDRVRARWGQALKDQANLGFLIPGGIGTKSATVCHAASVTSLANICEHVSTKVHDAVVEGLATKARPSAVAKMLDKAFGEGLKRSRMLAEHALTQAYSQGTLDSLEERGVTHVGTISEHSMGRMDRLSSIWGRDAEPMTAAGIAFKDRYGQLLFLHRTDGAGWAFPGGGVDAPETLENGAVREAQEELGGAPLGALKKVWQSVGYGVDYTTFEQAVEEPFEPAALNHEHDDWQWAAPEDAPQPLHPGAREMLRGLGLMDDGDDLEDDSVEVTGEDGRKYRVIKNEMGGWSVYANDAVDALFDDARKAPQPQHPKTGKFVKGFVAAREGRRSKLSGQFRKQGLTPQEQRREELREMRFSRVTGRLDVVTQGDDRVCDVCDEIADGGPYTINQARGLIPAHPHCRCIFKAASRSSIRDCERVLDFDADEPGRQGEEAGWTASNLS